MSNYLYNYKTKKPPPLVRALGNTSASASFQTRTHNNKKKP